MMCSFPMALAALTARPAGGALFANAGTVGAAFVHRDDLHRESERRNAGTPRPIAPISSLVSRGPAFLQEGQP